jgi:phosphoribosylformylglycinamidine cyclo-ligase
VKNPVLVASTDGVGTKLKLAFLTGNHHTVGEDLVNHCVNDILVQGARPLFFLDYLGLGRLEPGTVEAVVGGIARGCRANGCALLGGETAEMPDFYAPGEYDLAGTIIGIVEESRVLDGSAVREGDAVIALASSGLHTNGYSLARRVIFERMRLSPDDPFPEEEGTVGEVLLRVHRSYLSSLMPLLDAGKVRALAHITGGGLVENLPRVLPRGLSARIARDSWHVPAVFRVIAREGGVAEEEMFRAFNMGVGMVAVVAPAEVDGTLQALRDSGEEPWVAGEIVPGDGTVTLE